MGGGTWGLLMPPAQVSSPSLRPAHSGQRDCHQHGRLTGDDPRVSYTDWEAGSHQADSRGPSSVKIIQ